MREAFALQKHYTCFQQKYWHIWEINFWKFNETLSNDVVSFEQPGQELRKPPDENTMLNRHVIHFD